MAAEIKGILNGSCTSLVADIGKMFKEIYKKHQSWTWQHVTARKQTLDLAQLHVKAEESHTGASYGKVLLLLITNQYHNYKRTESIVLIAICDPDYY